MLQIRLYFKSQLIMLRRSEGMNTKQPGIEIPALLLYVLLCMIYEKLSFTGTYYNTSPQHQIQL